MKHWYRRWKIAAIETLNPDWRDLSKIMTDDLMFAPERIYKAVDKVEG